MKLIICKIAALVLITSVAGTVNAESLQPWTPAAAKQWYDAQAWPVGSNYLPASAINQLEMWQVATFDLAAIDRELGWAESLGMTTMRVFLHDLLWQQDPVGFKQRIDQFLAIAAKHHIKPVLVLFDSCWDPDPVLGPQRPPIPGVHNSGWVQSPSAAMLADPAARRHLQDYVEGVVGGFAGDRRILAWDVWNEPDNHGGGNGYYESREAKDKFALVKDLLPAVFEWARRQHPVQPLTSAVWNHDDWSVLDSLNAVEAIQLSQSDIISFHDYNWPEKFEARIIQLEKYHRPILCSEYMARGAGSTIDGSLRIGKKHNVGMINWGFVNGKTQTRYPWDSWSRPYTLREPTVWFHDLLQADGTPYREREMEILRRLSSLPKGVVDPPLLK